MVFIVVFAIFAFAPMAVFIIVPAGFGVAALVGAIMGPLPLDRTKEGRLRAMDEQEQLPEGVARFPDRDALDRL